MQLKGKVCTRDLRACLPRVLATCFSIVCVRGPDAMNPVTVPISAKFCY